MQGFTPLPPSCRSMSGYLHFCPSLFVLLPLFRLPVFPSLMSLLSLPTSLSTPFHLPTPMSFLPLIVPLPLNVSNLFLLTPPPSFPLSPALIYHLILPFPLIRQLFPASSSRLVLTCLFPFHAYIPFSLLFGCCVSSRLSLWVNRQDKVFFNRPFQVPFS